MRSLRAGALGAVAGVLWGIVARGFMRLLTESPEFSWGGTLFIVGGSAVVGSLVMLVREQRLAGRSGWWRLLGLPFVLLFSAAGALMSPGVVGVVMLADRRRWLWPPGLALVGLTVWAATQDLGGWPSGRQVAGLAVMLGCLAVEGLAARELVRKWRPRVAQPAEGSRQPSATVEAGRRVPVEARHGGTPAP